MKTKHLLGALLSFLCTIIFFSCGNNNEEKIYPLSFEKEYYEQPLLRATDVTSVNAVINLIQRYLKIDWEQLINKALTRSDYLIIPTLKTTIDNTDYTIIGTLDTRPEIPENILE